MSVLDDAHNILQGVLDDKDDDSCIMGNPYDLGKTIARSATAPPANQIPKTLGSPNQNWEGDDAWARLTGEAAKAKQAVSPWDPSTLFKTKEAPKQKEPSSVIVEDHMTPTRPISIPRTQADLAGVDMHAAMAAQDFHLHGSFQGADEQLENFSFGAPPLLSPGQTPQLGGTMSETSSAMGSFNAPLNGFKISSSPPQAQTINLHAAQRQQPQQPLPPMQDQMMSHMPLISAMQGLQYNGMNGVPVPGTPLNLFSPASATGIPLHMQAAGLAMYANLNSPSSPHNGTRIPPHQGFAIPNDIATHAAAQQQQQQQLRSSIQRVHAPQQLPPPQPQQQQPPQQQQQLNSSANGNGNGVHAAAAANGVNSIVVKNGPVNGHGGSTPNSPTNINQTNSHHNHHPGNGNGGSNGGGHHLPQSGFGGPHDGAMHVGRGKAAMQHQQQQLPGGAPQNGHARGKKGGGRNNGAQQPAQQQQQQPFAPQPAGSNVLEDFRRSKSRHWDLKNLTGHIAEFSKDQDGSRTIQKKLEMAGTSNNEEGRRTLATVFEELYPVSLPLMVDVFGNYVIQKLLEYGTPEQRERLCHAMKDNVVSLTKQTYGCRVVQKALDLVPLRLQTLVISELQGHVPQCVVDSNGNHVIQKCIEVVPDQSDFIIREFAGKVNTLATHPYGCRVIQKILEYCKREPFSPLTKACGPVLNEVVRSSRMLVTNQNGNYVVQHVMANAPRQFNEIVVNELLSDFAQLSCHKFASNVAEKVYASATAEQRKRVVELITQQPDPPLVTMMRDQFGNYVIQKMLDANDVCSRMLVVHIRPHFPTLQRTNFGKHIIAKVENVERGIAFNNHGPGRV
ncbi:Pumilio-like protein 3 [Diplonema papillatum]|nr:Pumilio-like protein 3 [Diplonema papillatum]